MTVSAGHKEDWKARIISISLMGVFSKEIILTTASFCGSCGDVILKRLITEIGGK